MLLSSFCRILNNCQTKPSPVGEGGEERAGWGRLYTNKIKQKYQFFSTSSTAKAVGGKTTDFNYYLPIFILHRYH